MGVSLGNLKKKVITEAEGRNVIKDFFKSPDLSKIKNNTKSTLDKLFNKDNMKNLDAKYLSSNLSAQEYKVHDFIVKSLMLDKNKLTKKIANDIKISSVVMISYRLVEKIEELKHDYAQKKVYEDALDAYLSNTGFTRDDVTKFLNDDIFKNISEMTTEFTHDGPNDDEVFCTEKITDIPKPATSWGSSANTNIFMVQETDSVSAFEKEWEDFSNLSQEQKGISDRESMRVRGKTNEQYYADTLPLIRNKENALKVTENVDFGKIKSFSDVKTQIFPEINNTEVKETLSNILNQLEEKFHTATTVVQKNTLRNNNHLPLSKNIAAAHITKDFLVEVTDHTKMAISGILRLVGGSLLAVGIAAIIILLLLSIMISIIFGLVVAVIGGTLATFHKHIIEKCVVADFKENVRELSDEGDITDKNNLRAIKKQVLEEIGIADKDTDAIISEDYNWDEMEFGLDALTDDYDDNTSDTMDEYDKENVDEESEFYKYAIEKESYNDTEVDDLIRRYMRIKDAGTFQKISNMFRDFRNAVRESAKKHGNFLIDTDEKDEEKDDKRMMTKAEAIAVVDATLASKYRMYLLAFEHFRRDTAKTMTFSLLLIIFFTCLTISGLVVLLPIGVVIGGTAGIGNWYAFFRDLKRTRLVIIKEIERIDNTVSRMSQDPNIDKEKIKQLLEIKKSLIIQAGYDEKSPKWNKLKDPAVVKKLTEMINYFGDTLSIDDIRVNIIEADAEDKATEEEPNEGELPTEEELGDDKEEESVDDSTTSDGGNLADAQEDYLNSNPTDGVGKEFNDGGSEQEEQYKLRYCVKNLSVLHDKYTELKRDVIASDTYKIVNEDDTNKLKQILVELVNELGFALENLHVYIEVGDKSTYAVTALKLSIHQNILRVIDEELKNVITNANKEMLKND